MGYWNEEESAKGYLQHGIKGAGLKPSEMETSSEKNPIETSSLSLTARGTRWKTALLVCGSALLGATAVALWNRRVLEKIQSQSPAQEAANLNTARSRHRIDEDYF